MGVHFFLPGRKVCLLILKEEGLKMMNPFVGRKNPVECCRKGAFFLPLSDGRYPPRITRPGARTGIQAGANIRLGCRFVMRGGVCNFFQLQFLYLDFSV